MWSDSICAHCGKQRPPDTVKDAPGSQAGCTGLLTELFWWPTVQASEEAVPAQASQATQLQVPS